MASGIWRGRASAAGLAVIVAAATACTTDGGSTARLGHRSPRVRWLNSDAHWVSQPRTAGGRFVAYLERDGFLSVAGVDTVTGALAWEVPASASGLTPGVELGLASDDRLVYFATPVDVARLGPSVFVVAVDAATGSEVWRTTTPLTLTDSLYECDDDSTAFCVSDRAPGPDRPLRIAKSDGTVTVRSPSAEPPAEPPLIGRSLGAGLYDLGFRGPELIAAIEPSGRTLWTKTATELFRGRPVSSDFGWNWQRYGDVLVGSLGWIDADRSSIDLSQVAIAGVDAATGSVLWVDDGAELGCSIDGRIEVSLPQPIRCRRTGTATNDLDHPDSDPVVTGLSMGMEGFDPTTGATRWQADLGPALALILDTAPLVRLSPTEFAVGRDDGTSVAVDIVTGRTRTPALDEIGWCVSENTVRDRRTLRDPDRRRGQSYLSQCRPDGSRIDGLVSRPTPGGAWRGQIFAWVDADGLHGATTGWVRWSSD